MHFLSNGFAKMIREIGTLPVHAEDAIDFRFNPFSEQKMVDWIISEALFVLFGECILSFAWIDFRTWAELVDL